MKKIKIQTAERCSSTEESDSVMFKRQLFAYEQAVSIVNRNVAEVGCGEGYGMHLLLPNVNVYMAMDKYPTKIAGEQTEKVIFKRLKFPDFKGVPRNFFDFIICFQVIEHIKNDKLFISEIAQLLKPDGKLLLTTPNAHMSLTRNPFHVREYELEELKYLLSNYFEKLNIQGIFGTQKVKNYYETNKASVAIFRKWDIFDFEHKLPACLLKIPYNLLNRLNRYKLLQQNNKHITDISTDDFYLSDFNITAYDFFVIAENKKQ